MSRRLFRSWGILSLAWLCLATSSVGDQLGDRFAQAAIAYDASEYAEAIRLYQQVQRDGFVSAELFYNLGNAWFRQGDVGQAVLHYKKALHLQPRNGDIRHNLAFVMNDAGALASELSWISRILRYVSMREWWALSIIFWWTTAIIACLALWKRWDFSWTWPLLLSLLLTVISLSGVAVWWGLTQRPEIVVIQSGQDALFAPLEGSTPHFALPKGSTARIESTTEGWYRVRVGDRDGWIRQSAAAPVRPVFQGQ